MKTFKYILSVLLAAFVIAGCTDEVEYTPGAPENDDSYGVYFPTQPGTKLELEPSDPTTKTYRIKRHNTRGAIRVPVVLRASADGIFTISDVKFADGQKETTFSVNFPNAEIGKEYTVTLSVEDPAYAYTYNELSTGLDLTVSRVEWKDLGTGKWRDDIISSMFQIPNPHAEIDVKIQERGDKPGYYRVLKPYSNNTMMKALLGGQIAQGNTEVDLIVDASNSDKVYIPYQSTGVTLGGDGEVEIASYTPEIFSVDESAALYGKLKDGIVSFPVQGIMVNFTVTGGWYYSNGSGKTRLMLPGSREYDYTVGLTKGLPSDGEVELGVEFGSDITRVTYAIYEGRLTSGQAQIKSLDMHDNKKYDGELTATSKLTVKGRETGIYTIVTCNYDAQGSMQGYSYLPFGYVAAGDTKPVVLTVYAELTSEFLPEGHTRENSMRIGGFGEEIESGYYGLFKTEQLAEFTPDQYEQVVMQNGKAFDAEQLEAINGEGWNTLVGGLTGGTSYTLLVTANNGYFQSTFKAVCETEGELSPLQILHTADDITGTLEKEKYIGAWDYYAVDGMDKTNKSRQYFGKVTIADYTQDPQDLDLISIRGLSGVESQIGGNDTQLAIFDGGMIYTISDQLVGRFQDFYIGNLYTCLEDETLIYSGQRLLIGAPVGEGLVAFVGNPQLIESEGLTFVGCYFGGFSSFDSQTGEFGGFQGGMAWYKYQLLADPAVYPTPASAAAAAPTFEPSNYVEIRGIDRLAVISGEYFENRLPKSVGEQTDVEFSDNAGGDRAEGIEVEVGEPDGGDHSGGSVEIEMLPGLKRVDLQVIR